jgi:hypothetical protein
MLAKKKRIGEELADLIGPESLADCGLRGVDVCPSLEVFAWVVAQRVLPLPPPVVLRRAPALAGGSHSSVHPSGCRLVTTHPDVVELLPNPAELTHHRRESGRTRSRPACHCKCQLQIFIWHAIVVCIVVTHACAAGLTKVQSCR